MKKRLLSLALCLALCLGLLPVGVLATEGGGTYTPPRRHAGGDLVRKQARFHWPQLRRHDGRRQDPDQLDVHRRHK